MVAVSGQGLVDRVVDHLVDEMVQTAFRRAADIHARTLANGLQAFQYLNLISAIVAVDRRDISRIQIGVNLDVLKIEIVITQLFSKPRRLVFAQLFLSRVRHGTVERLMERVLLIFLPLRHLLPSLHLLCKPSILL